MGTFFFLLQVKVWGCVGWRFALSRSLVIQTVVGRPYCVIWPRCRWRLCSQSEPSWRLFPPRSPTTIVFPLTLAQGFSIKKNECGSLCLVSGMVWEDLFKSCLEEALITAHILLGDFLFLEGQALFCVLRKPVWSCCVIFPSVLFLSGDNALCLSKIEQHRSRENRGKNVLKDYHRLRLVLEVCSNIPFFLWEQPQALTF